VVGKSVKVDTETLELITANYPDLKGEADAVIVRIGVKRLIADAKNEVK